MTNWFYVGPDHDKPRDSRRDPEDARSFPVVVCEERLAAKYVEFWMADSRVPEPKMKAISPAGFALDPGGPWNTKWKVLSFDLDGLLVRIAACHIEVWAGNKPWAHEERCPGDEPFTVFEGKWQSLCLYKPHADRLFEWIREIAPEAERIAKAEVWKLRAAAKR